MELQEEAWETFFIYYLMSNDPMPEVIKFCFGEENNKN